MDRYRRPVFQLTPHRRNSTNFPNKAPENPKLKSVEAETEASHGEIRRVFVGLQEPGQCPVPPPVETEWLILTFVPKSQLLRTPPCGRLLARTGRPKLPPGTAKASTVKTERKTGFAQF